MISVSTDLNFLIVSNLIKSIRFVHFTLKSLDFPLSSIRNCDFFVNQPGLLIAELQQPAPRAQRESTAPATARTSQPKRPRRAPHGPHDKAEMAARYRRGCTAPLRSSG